MAPSAEKDERKAEILRRHKEGQSGASIAREIGVSRQYVHFILKQFQSEGESRTLAKKKRGRKRDRPLTPRELDAVRARLRAGQDGAGGAHPGLTAKAVTTWFKESFGHTMTVHQLRKLCTDEGYRLAPPPERAALQKELAAALPPLPEEPPAPLPVSRAGVPPRRRGRPRKDAPPVESDRLTSDALQAMEQSNREISERIAAQRRARVPATAKNPAPKINRNDPCPFDSSKKFKRCCGAKGSKWCLRQAEEAGAAAPAKDQPSGPTA